MASAGTDTSAPVPVSPELLAWADIIIAMEKAHINRIRKRFRSALKNQRLICLNIPDEYEYMAPALITLLKAVVPKYLPR